MKLTITIISLLAAVAMAIPAVVNNPLEARFDCNTCGCSSSDACTVSCPAVLPAMLRYTVLTLPDRPLAAR